MGVSVFQNPSFVWGCASLAGVCFAAAGVVWARAFWAELAARFLSLPPSGKAALVTFVAVATAVAQKDGNVATDYTDSHGSGESLSTDYTDSHGLGEVVVDRIDKIEEKETTPCLSNSVTSVLSESNSLAVPSAIIRDNPCQSVDKTTVMFSDIARGFRLAEVRMNEAVSYEMPTNGTVVGTWHLTDAYDAVVKTGLGISIRDNPCQSVENISHPFRFPIGNHVVTSLWAHVWGKARLQLKNASNELVAVGAPMFARHGVSRLWTAATTNGSALVTWERFFLGNPHEGVLSTDYTDSRGSGECLSTEDTDYHGLREGLSTDYTDSHGLSEVFLDRFNKIDRFDVKETTPCLSNSVASVLSESRSTDPTSGEIRDNPCNSCNPWTYPLISAQLELFPSGDFIARSNAVERVYRRVNPDDWDDDGIPNDEDDDPRIAADETQFGPHQTLPENANENAYCRVDLVVPQANALVTFAGDGASNLADPSFVAKVGEVNRVTLLIGKTYRVTCPLPFRIVAKSNDEIEESWEADGSLLLRWPVSVSSAVTDEDDSSAAQRAAIRQAMSVGISNLALSPLALLAATTTATLPPTRSHTFAMSVVPSGLGGFFDWTTHCCSISGTAYSFEQTCRGACACSGCSTEGFFEYEGYRLRVYGPSCPCLGEPDDPNGGDGDKDEDPLARGVSAYFTKTVIFLEDEYENAPGETVPWQSTETELVCSAAGGPFGGRVSIKVEGADNLIQYTGPTLPFEQSLGKDEEISFKIRYRAVKESGAADDIKVTATFTENETGWKQKSLDTAMAVRVELTPEKTVNDCMHRHRWGICERIWCAITPLVDGVRIKACAGARFDAAQGGSAKCLVCPEEESSGLLVLTDGSGASFAPTTSTVKPRAIQARNVRQMRSSLPAGVPGGAGMELSLHVMPDDVSFMALSMQEKESDSEISGYFENEAFSAVWRHNDAMGANEWHLIGLDNFFFVDAAKMMDALILPCREGVLVWHIPILWQNAEDTDGIDHELESVDQKFEMSGSGTLRVSKFGFWVERALDGTLDRSEGVGL